MSNQHSLTMGVPARSFSMRKISEGCNHRCSFCIIPSMRGDLVSRPASDVVAEQGIVARGKADAPKIDGVVYLNEETNHQSGDIVIVKVHASDEHDLWANSVS